MSFLFHVSNSTPAGIGGIDEYTVLMTHFDGDQSDEDHTIEHIGATVYSSTQSKFGGSSLNYPTLSDYIVVTNNLTDFDPGSGNFTIDWWEYRTSIADYTTSISRDVSGTYTPYIFGFGYNNDLVYFMTSTGSSWDIADTRVMDGTPSLNTWVHFAVVRSGNTFYTFKNGVQTDTFTSAAAIIAGAQNFAIGKSNLNGFTGYIEEVRYSNVARWTSNFTPSTTEYISDANTKLLLHLDGDVSTTPHTITNNGNPQLNATTAKFDGAIYFDGTGDYLEIPDSTDFDFGVDDYTVDLWLKIDSHDASFRYITGFAYDWTSNDEQWVIGLNTDNKLTATFSNASGDYVTLVDSTVLTTGSFQHIAFVRNINSFLFYVNGILADSDTYTKTGQTPTGSYKLNCGRTPAGNYPLTGYIDELRISKGIARWTSNFTPETGPYTT